MTRILFLTMSGRRGASTRYRVFQYLPYLERAGYKAAMLPPAEKKGRGLRRLLSGIAEERACLKAALDADIVFIQKRLFGKGFLKRLKALGKTTVFDFDDNIFTSPTGSWSAVTKRKVAGRIGAVLGMSSLVITGNGFLAALAREGGAARVEVLPTGIGMGKYMQKEHDHGGPVVLGWIGSSVNHPYLDQVSGTLPRLAAGPHGLKLLVVSDKDYHMEGVDVINRRWSEETEAHDLLDMDIGLMPLPDNDWTRGKCALKALQYMASGIPAVCSAVGAALDVVDNGVNGCLFGQEDELQKSIGALISSVEKRAAMGEAGRRSVEEKYSMEVLGPRLVLILDSLRGSGRA